MPDEIVLPPLIEFSVYTHFQASLLNDRAKALLSELDLAFSADGVDGGLFTKIYGEFWLWTLGAYECTRTMSQHSHCFSTAAVGRIQNFKRSISKIRMPFAKQELQGKSLSFVKHELSVTTVDSNRKDFAFRIEDKAIWMRGPLQDFGEFIESISAEDVLSRLGTPKAKGTSAA